MSWYPLEVEGQCIRCGGLPPGHDLIGVRNPSFPHRWNGGRFWKCPGRDAHEVADVEYRKKIASCR